MVYFVSYFTLFLGSLIEMVSVALFLPNIIGYVRAITGIISFLFVDTNPKYVCSTCMICSLFCCFYFFSYILDAMDGVAARKFNQCLNLKVVFIFRLSFWSSA